MKLAKTALAVAASTLIAGSALAQAPEVLTTHAPKELAEGLVFGADGTAYISVLQTKEIRTYAPDGTTGVLAKIDVGPGIMPGLNIGPDGALYSLVNNTKEGSGLWRVEPGENAVPTHWADFSVIEGSKPNHPTFNSKGEAYVSMTAPGEIYKVSADGKDIEIWAQSPWLSTITIPSLGFKLGANGSVLNADEDILYVSNTSKNLVAKVMINDDGSAGEITCWFGHHKDCEFNSGGALEGNDGLAIDPDGSIYIASGINNRIVKVTQDGYMKVLAEGAPLQYPVIVAFPPENYDEIYITNLDLMRYAGALGFRALPAASGLLKLDISE